MEDGGEDVIYQLRVILEGISPLIWRRLLVPGDYSIADLHYILQTAFDWDNVHLHRFEIYGKEYGIGYVGGMSFWDNPREVRLADFKFRKGEKFLYEYDFGDSWRHLIRVEDILKPELKKKYPLCTGGRNLAPIEDYYEDESFIETQDESSILLGEKLKEFYEMYRKFLDCLTDEENDEKSIAAFRGQAQQLQDIINEIKRLNHLALPETFDRRKLNRTLLKYSQNRGMMPEEEYDEIQSADFSGKR
jgi:hypothetical protein